MQQLVLLILDWKNAIVAPIYMVQASHILWNEYNFAFLYFSHAEFEKCVRTLEIVTFALEMFATDV